MKAEFYSCVIIISIIIISVYVKIEQFKFGTFLSNLENSYITHYKSVIQPVYKPGNRNRKMGHFSWAPFLTLLQVSYNNFVQGIWTRMEKWNILMF